MRRLNLNDPETKSSDFVAGNIECYQSPKKGG